MHKQAVKHLRSVDPALRVVIDRVGPCTYTIPTDGSHFAHIVRSIVYQQLSGKAAATIHGRVAALCKGEVTPARLLKATDAQLRAAGLSERKTQYVKELAARTKTKELPIDRLHELDDDAVLATLVQVRGIGRWTAQMVLMFRLGRPDILPELDLGIQKGAQKLLRMRKLPTPEKLQRIGAKWAPYRTVASWYLWRSLDVPE
jgi:DNA-3-methyladenine glycosylase II